MVLFEIHARFKGHFLNELCISSKIINIYSTKIILRDEKLQLNKSVRVLLVNRNLVIKNTNTQPTFTCS